MRLLILTSKDHPYGNFLLKQVFSSGVLEGCNVMVLEQDCVFPKKTKMQGLRKYVRVSGLRYVVPQIVKQELFILRRALDHLRGRTESPFHPYWLHAPAGIVRRSVKSVLTPIMLSEIAAFKPDAIFSAYSKEILPPAVLDLPPLGCINLHPSPLPAYQGVSPTFWVLADGGETAGATLHFMDERIDTGDIVARREFPAKAYVTEHALYMHATALGAEMCVDALKTMRSGARPAATKSAGEAFYRSLPTKDAVDRFLRRGMRFFRLRELLA